MEKCKSFPESSSSSSSSSYCSASSSGGRANSNAQSRSDLAYNFNGPKVKVNAFSIQNDPEIKRRKRVASYKVLTVEGKVKSSVRNSFRWLKTKYTEMRYGW